MLYAEWARLITGGEPGSGQVRRLEDDGFLVDVDEEVALRRLQVDDTGAVTDVQECRDTGTCAFLSDQIVRPEPCEPQPGCPTVDSDTGAVRAVQVASLHHREPVQIVIYQLQTEQQITSLTEPAARVFWDDNSDFFVLSFPRQPAEDTTLVLTITFADGQRDRLTMRFNAPIEGAPAGATTTAPG
jgi:hypothetical protein